MAPSTPTNARRLMTMTALYVSWVWTVTGCELSPSKVFKPELAHRYAEQMLGQRSAAYKYDTVRQLSYIADRLGACHIPRLRASETPCAPPYSLNEAATLYAWANSLTTSLKRRNAKALLALSGGAGLTAQELMDAHVDDVETIGGITYIAIRGNRPRRVPVLTKWTRTLHSSIDGRQSGYIFQAHRLNEYEPHGLQRFLGDNPCPVRPSSTRLRSGWIITQINSGLPLKVLLEITGLTALGSLSPYLELCPQQSSADFATQISGAGAV